MALVFGSAHLFCHTSVLSAVIDGCSVYLSLEVLRPGDHSLKSHVVIDCTSGLYFCLRKIKLCSDFSSVGGADPRDVWSVLYGLQAL